MDVITRRARDLALSAMDAGWSGPPFDPIALAEHLGIPVDARDGIADARTVPEEGTRVRIEYNPNRPAARVRYSLAHEIAHTLFPDCHEQVRNRAARAEIEGDEWQLEALCNLGAAELLMPAGSLPHLAGEELRIERLMDLRKRFEVSAEALLIRATRLADEPCAAFCATRVEAGRHAGRYRIDYVVPSAGWEGGLPRNTWAPEESVLGECTAIGYTARGPEQWQGIPDAYVECVGIPPYPGAAFPRVVGVLRAQQHGRGAASLIRYVRGDALTPRGSGPRLIAHIVNDRTTRWGGRGFASALARRFPSVSEEFESWVKADPSRLALGAVFAASPASGLTVANMVAQRGFGPSQAPRIRYSALRDCLEQVAAEAQRRGASVHMPRIGTGEAGGSWAVVEELVLATLVAAGADVTVYDLPGGRGDRATQTDLTLPLA